MNYRATIAYDGTDYFGWQIQANHRTIQAEISHALAKLEGTSVTVHGAGRTDTGVHAEGQVASFQLTREWSGKVLQRAINGNLPQDIRVMSVETVDDEFHARYSARGKTYRYQLCNAEVMSPLIARYAWHYPYQLNIEKLKLDAEVLIGTYDFSAFTVASCETESKVRTITDLRVDADRSMMTLYFSGEGFLRYQVRTMVSC
ncbi:MAG TPA: tRNA pseudouridine(38-40) synthase TruA, partial [Blastocatellia bacterium]|nr:tRNA pseudouridine(38-40) synthase TruA [Blastocatellia bacterium]